MEDVLERPRLEYPEKTRQWEAVERETHPELAKQIDDIFSKPEGTGTPQEENLRGLRVKLREAVDETLGKSDEAIRQEAEAQNRKIPDIVLKGDASWERVGWNSQDRESVRTRLKEVLGLDDNSSLHALECFVAFGKKPSDIHTVLNNVLNNVDDAGTNLDAAAQSAANTYHDNAGKWRKFLLLKELGIEREDYIQRFILKEDFAREVDAQHYGNLDLSRNGGGLYEEAWSIGYKEEEFGLDGDHSILRMQVQKNEDGTVEGRYVVDQANWMHWMRKEIYRHYTEMDTNELTNYFSALKVSKGDYTSVSLGQMILQSDTYFKDDAGVVWKSLYNQAVFEPFLMYVLRGYYLEYEKVRHDGKRLVEFYNSKFFYSDFTRKMGGMTLMDFLFTLPSAFNGKNSDTMLGQSLNEMYLIYYNMADFDMLEGKLGKNSDFFKRDWWLNIIKDVYKSDLDDRGVPVLGNVLGEKTDVFTKAFGKNGEIIDKEAFIKFVNLFPSPTNPGTGVDVVISALKKIVQQRFQKTEITKDGEKKTVDLIDNDSLNFGWLLIRSLTLPTGVEARNNFDAVSGYTYDTKLIHPFAYQWKYFEYGGGGIPAGLGVVKRLSSPLFEAILLENSNDNFILEYDKNGKPVRKNRQRTAIEVLNSMQEVTLKYFTQRSQLEEQLKLVTDEHQKAALQRRMALLFEEERNVYKTVSGQLMFHQNAMKNYAENIVGRSQVIWDTLIKAKEIDFEKFSKYDNIFRGVSFNHAEWQGALQDGLITPLRYLINASGTTQLNMTVRAPALIGRDERGRGKWEFRDMPLGEAMFGHQVLDIPKFRLKAKDVPTENWQKLKKKGCKKKGKYVLGADGQYIIDYDRVQSDKTLAYKQLVLGILAFQLRTHIDNHSTDPGYDMEHVMTILHSIEHLPGGIDPHPNNMKKTRIIKTFFSHEQMKWLKKITGATYTKLFSKQIFADLFGMGHKGKKESITGQSFSIFFSRIFQGY